MLMIHRRCGPTKQRFTLAATTTGAATVTIARLTVNVAGVTIAWGDGVVEALPANSTVALTHNYAGAGTWSIVVSDARRITQIDLRDAKLGRLNTAQLVSSPITYFYVTAITASTIRSADVAAWRPTHFYLYSLPAGCVVTFASADVAAWRPTYFGLYSLPAAGCTYTFAASCMRDWTAVAVVRVDGLALLQAVVDVILADIYAGRMGYTNAAPTLNVGGTNAAPSGVYADEDPPVTGKGMIYELVNDPEVPPEGFKKWGITYTA